MPRVSVIIITKNNGETIRECIDSLLDQTIPAEEYELVFVDGHSHDGTDETIREYASRHFSIRLLYEEYGKMGYARNLGVKNSSGSIIVFTDGDAIVPRSWLEQIIQSIQADGLDAVGGLDVLASSGEGDSLIDSWRRLRRVTGIKSIPCIKTVNFAIRRDSLILVEGFDRNLSHWDEAELLAKLASKKKASKIVYDPGIVVYHKRPRSSGLTSRIKKTFRKSLIGTSVLMRSYVIRVALSNLPSTIGLSFLFVPVCILGILIVVLSILMGFFIPLLILCSFSFLALLLIYSLFVFRKTRRFAMDIPFLLALDFAVRFVGTFFGLIRWLATSRRRLTSVV